MAHVPRHSATVLLFLLLNATWVVQAAERPNVVFILADDLSWSDLACYGNSVHDTPHIDRLASRGVRFTQAYAPSAICSASRAAFLTGKTPARLHFEFVTKADPGAQRLDVSLQSPPFTLDLPLEEITLGELLGAVGYDTAFFGKWHVSRHHEGYLGWSPTHGPPPQGFVHGSSAFGSHPYSYRAEPALRKRPVAEGEFPPDRLTDEAIAFVEQPHDQPFFLYLSHYFVHDPIHSRCGWLIDKYRDRLPPDAADIRASYGAMVETLDHLVGRVVEAIERAGLMERTLIVFTSDNGGHPRYTSNAPLRGSKWNLYEGGIRVPLIASWPGTLPEGAQCEAVVHGCDLFATFGELAEGTVPSNEHDSASLLPLLRDPTHTFDSGRSHVWHFPYYHPETRFEQAPARIGVSDFQTSRTEPHSAIRRGDWKLLQFYEDDRVELYNLRSDLAEQHDLAATHPDKAAALQTELADYLSRVDARLPVRRDQKNGP